MRSKRVLPDYCLKKLENCLKKNPDLEAFISEENDLEFRFKTQYSPLVSCDVERSFSNYTVILTDKRHSLTEDNIEKYIFINYNKVV